MAVASGAASGPSIREGAIVAGRYRIDRRIGAGGMGEVWAGVATNGDAVAVKILLPETAKDKTLVARFRREASLLARLESPRVARVLDFVDDPAAGLAIVMKYVAGKSLGARLADGPVALEEAVEIGAEVAAGLTDLHDAEIVHRDLKPDNVILAREGDRTRAVIVDLGVSRLSALASPASTDELVNLTAAETLGTLPYMAPEQLVSSGTAGAPADVYALGAVLYRAVVGKPVFDLPDEGEVARAKLLEEAPAIALTRVDRVAVRFASIVARALRRLPDDRPKAAELARELEELREIAYAAALELEAPTEHASMSPVTLAHPTQRMSEPPTMSALSALSGLASTDPSPAFAASKPSSTPPASSASSPREHGEDPLERSISLGSRPTVTSPILVTPPYESPMVALVIDPTGDRASRTDGRASNAEATAVAGESLPPRISSLLPSASPTDPASPGPPGPPARAVVAVWVAIAMALVALTLGSGVGFAVGAFVYGAHGAH